jgi:hypothetical protein
LPTHGARAAEVWKGNFDELLSKDVPLTVPLEGNGKSLASLAVRVSDAAKWLADQWRQGQFEAFKPYAEINVTGRFKLTHLGVTSN